MLRLAEKAFAPAPIPFPVMHVDTGHNFPEVLDYRDRRVAQLGLTLDRGQRAGGDRRRHWSASRPTAPATGSRPRCCSTRSRSTASTRCSAAPGATRRRPGPRSGCSASATSSASGTRRTSGPSCGRSTTAGTTRASRSGCSRCPTGPSWTSGTTSPASRSSCRRSTSRTSARWSSAAGMLYARQRVPAGCAPARSRPSSRCATAPSATRPAPRRCCSDADTIEKVIDEVAATRITERGATRGDDKVSEAAMEDRKREGYF